MKKNIILLLSLVIVFASSCRDEDLIDEIDKGDYSDYTSETHGNVDPNYAVVFNQTEVLRLDITISEENWTLMQADLSSVMSSGTSGPGGGGPGGGGTPTTSFDDPMWIDCTVKFDSLEWNHVGIRYKGNSSLQSAYQSGNNKLSLKLDFDEFEDTYASTFDQRFYGFKQLNLNNNYDDASLMREKVGADLFRDFGLVSAQTSFCVVYIDYGQGSQYYGVYTLVEEVDNTVIKTQFASNDGNLYKPDGDAATFANGTYDTGELYLKTNTAISDYSDVRALYDVINSSDRTINTETWKTNLEAVFNVDIFLKWLAANTVMQNWDTYGTMSHNYYLYNNPDDNLLTWIPWDNNEALQDGKNGGALSLGLSEVSSSWPLIKYIIDQAEYKQQYEAYMLDFINTVFIPGNMTSTYTDYYYMLKTYAYAEEAGYTFLQSNADFDAGVNELKSHVSSRNSAVNSY